MRDNITKTGEPPVSYEEACARVRKVVTHTGHWNASHVAAIIWPNNKMSAQGRALAAGHMIKRMVDDGILRLSLVDEQVGLKYRRGFKA